MLKASGLTKKFHPNEPAVLKSIDLEIHNGDYISLMGRSGSGKSTLLYLLSTLDRNFEGSVHYDDSDVKSMSVAQVHQVRNTRMGFVFQFHYLLAELSALENVLLPARKANNLRQREHFARDLLKSVDLGDKMDRLPPQLSGGEQQRVAIARALVMRPEYVFADEPTGNLDTINGNLIFDLFERFNREYGTTIIYVTHDVEFGSRAKRRIQLVDGQIIQDSGQHV